jgi:hypothetical protein
LSNRWELEVAVLVALSTLRFQIEKLRASTNPE